MNEAKSPAESKPLQSPFPGVCSACHGELEEGFIPETNGRAVFVMYWVQGPPERSFWGGLKFLGKEHRNVVAMRCKSCGRLEFYAK